MSAKKISLNSKPLIAVVLVLLAVVAAVNVMVFKPGRRPAQRAEVRVQAAQSMPVDLDEFRREVASRGDLAAWANTATPALQRDPFGGRRVAEPVQVPTVTPDVELPAPNQELVCNAVLLSGRDPAVVINGKSYRVGEIVREYQVAAIGALGVKLTQANGADLFLSVHSDRGHSGRGRIVTKSGQTNGLNNTSLVEHARSERK